MLVKGIFQLELLKNRFERNLDSLVKPGNDDFLCVFHEQATQTQDCDTASKSGNDDYVALLMVLLVSKRTNGGRRIFC